MCMDDQVNSYLLIFWYFSLDEGRSSEYIYTKKYVFIVNLQLNPHWCEQNADWCQAGLWQCSTDFTCERKCVAMKTSVHNHEGPGLASSNEFCVQVCMYTQFTKEVVGHYKHHYNPL